MINFVVLLVVLVFRYKLTNDIAKTNVESNKYVNLIQIASRVKKLTIIDGLNTFLIFFSLFYYTSQTFEKLYQIAIFFVKIAKQMINQMILMFFLIFVFAVSFFAFYEQRAENLNDFSSILISMYSLSFGNSFLKESERLIADLGKGFYYVVSVSKLIIDVDY